MSINVGDSYVVTEITIPPPYHRAKNRALLPGKIVTVVHIHSEMHVTLKEMDSRYRFVVDPYRDRSWFRIYLKKIPSIISKEDQRLAKLLFSQVY